MRLWLARDKDSELCLYGHKPYKDIDAEVWKTDKDDDCLYFDIKTPGFSDIKWSDDEPVEVELRRIDE